ncbi:PAS domain-containing protein [Flavipsychrobacter stenotrophus]|nr:PAS domain-containing protein [Flavipsychrobacter stenotrophus]
MESPFAFCVMKGKDMTVTLANDLTKEFWGKGMDVEGKTLMQVLPEMKNQPFPAMLDSVYTTGIPVYVNEMLARLQHKDEMKERYFNIVYQPDHDADGTISGVITIAYDVTEMILACKKIEESDKRYNMMLMHSPFTFAVLKGRDLVIAFANDRVKAVWGKGNDVEGKSLLNLMPELKDTPFPALMDEVMATGVPYQGREVQSPHNVHGHAREEYFNFVFQPYWEADQTISGITIIGYDVTEQVIAKRKIEESEQRFRSLVEKSPFPISIFKGKELKMEVANEPLLKIFNVGKEVLGKPLLEILPEMKEQPFMALLLDVLENGATHYGSEQPAYFLRENGEKDTRYFNFVYQPYRENDRSVSGVMSLATDVTEQVVARKKIEAQVIMHEEMLMNAPYVACTLEGPNHVFSLVNKQYQQLFGSRILKGKPFIKALPEMEGQGFDKLLDNIYNTGETYVGFDIPVTFAREEGHTPELGYFNFSYQPMFDENRKIYSILGFGYEVTEIVKAKLIIEESELQFRVLTNSMPQKITNADAAGNMIFFNQKWLDDTGLTFDELKDWGWEKSIHTDDLKLTVANWKHSIATGDVFDMECRIQNKEGEYRWHLSRAVPIKDETGKILMWVGSNTDIHEQKEQRKELEKAVEKRTEELKKINVELENANRDLTAFAYISSHDLQEPLRKINNFVDVILAEEEQNLSDLGKKYFLRLRETSKRMQVLIKDLLAFSSSGNSEKIFEKTDLNLLLDEVKFDFEEIIQQKKATIDATGLGDMVVIRFQFRQLLNNLIGNSLKFSKENTAPHITITSKIEKGSTLNNEKLLPEINYCHIIFTDNGIGFEAEYQDRIFEVFQRLHSVEEYKGTGIGLAICKRIVENHNGIITSTSELNEGARFDIYIPVDPVLPDVPPSIRN